MQGPIDSTPDRIPVSEGLLDLAGACLLRGEDRVVLSATEVALLRFLVRHEGEVVSRETLLTEVWGYAPQVVSRAVDSAVKRVRRKIDPDERNLLTVFGEGYRFVRSTAQTPAIGPAGLSDAAVRQRLAEAGVTGDLRWAGLLGGSPLAVEEAVRRLRTVDVDSLVRRLQTAPFEALPAMRDALQVVWDDTPPDLQDAWGRVARLGPGFTTGMAATLVSVGAAHLDGLRELGVLHANDGGWSLVPWAARFADLGPARPDCDATIRSWALEQAANAGWTPTRLAPAFPTLRKAWRDDAPNADLARVLAAHVRRTEGPAAALAMLEAVEPRVDVAVERAACLVELGRAADALTVLDEAEAEPCAPDVAVMRQVWRSRVAETLDDAELRLSAARAAVAVPDANPHVLATAHNALAETWFAQGALEAGVESNRTARALVGPDADAAILDVTLGMALWRAGETASALEIVAPVAARTRQADVAAMAEAIALRCDRDPARAARLVATWWALEVLHNRVVVACTLVPFLVEQDESAAAVPMVEALLAHPLPPEPQAHLRGWLALARGPSHPMRRALARQARVAGLDFAEALSAALTAPSSESVAALRALTWAL